MLNKNHTVIYKKFFLHMTLFILFAFFGCASNVKSEMSQQDEIKNFERDLKKADISRTPLYSLLFSLKEQEEINIKLKDSLQYIEKDNEKYQKTIEDLTLELKEARSLAKINIDFRIPSYIEFAGERVNLTSPRTYNKFLKIYENEVKYAYKYIPRSGYYFPFIQKILKEHGIPEDAKYLAVAESFLNPMAKSWAGAVGIWQFMPKTAAQYGMKINEFIDERRDIKKSTISAAKYLNDSKRFLKRYGTEDWLLVMASYNAGIGNIRNVILKQGGKSFNDLILKTDETNKYVWRAIAIKLIFENQEQIFGKKFETKESILDQMKEINIVLKGYHKIDKWAVAQGTSLRKIWENNHWINIYKTNKNRYSKINNVILPPGKYTLFIPKDAKKNKKLLAIEMKKFANSKGEALVYYKVKKGDNLYKISRLYKIPIAELKKLNNLKSNTIYPGQKLRIYTLSKYVYSKKNYYTVESGDSIYKIASKLKVSPNYLISLNKLEKIVILHPGQKLKY